MITNSIISSRKIYTGLWSLSTEDMKSPFVKLFSGDSVKAEEFHKLYFQWYNLIHEFTHILREHYKINYDWYFHGAREEQAANDFAMAYWKTVGEKDKLSNLISNIEYILTQIPSPIKNDTNFLDYCDEHFSEMQSLESYSFLQFTSVKNAFHSHETLQEVLYRFGFQNIANLDDIQLNYTDGSSTQTIVDDCISILNKLGIETPKVEVVPCNNLLIQRAE